MAEHLSQSELDYPFKLMEYLNGFRISKVWVLCFVNHPILSVSWSLYKKSQNVHQGHQMTAGFLHNVNCK